MKISPQWLREFVDVKASEAKMAEALTLAGIAVEGISGEGTSTIFEMEIGTNRVDAMNHYGIARELSAIYDVGLKPLTTDLPSATGECPIKVRIEEPALCARFSGQAICNVKIGTSQEKVRKRFEALGQKLINNAADATNYVLLEAGKPTHAFDLHKLAGGTIIVRKARAGEKIKTLDGVDRTLHPEDLIIADAEKPVGIAGVIGGWDTMITDSTKNVFIESAWFDPVSVRRTAKRHLIHTDASHRFERGADWASCPQSVERVAALILKSNGELWGAPLDIIARQVGNKPVTLSRSEVLRILGKEILAPELERTLTRLGFKLTNERAIQERRVDYTIAIPTWRPDVEREIDVIEEIARLHGYNQFPNTLPAFAGGVMELPDQLQRDFVRETLRALGYHEAVLPTFIPVEDAAQFSTHAPVLIANPLSAEAAAMRNSLVPSMLNALAHNLNRGQENVRLFECGHIYTMVGDVSLESSSLCIGATGAAIPAGPHQSARAFDFFDLKGAVETLLAGFTYRSITYDKLTGATFHPGRSARILLNSIPIATFGQVHPEIAATRKIKQDVYIAEIELARLLATPLRTPQHRSISRFPAVERDFSFVFADETTFDRIHAAVLGLKLPQLVSCDAIEIFRGEKVGDGKYSILVRVTFQSHERTLADEEVAAWCASIIEALKALGGVQR